MAKLRDGCLPEERKKLMSYLSVYEPKSTNYSKTKYDPARSKGRRDSSSSSSSSSLDDSASSGEMTSIDPGRQCWMEESARADVSAVAAGSSSKGEERLGVWEATMESQDLISAKQERRGAQEGKVEGEDSQGRQVWDASFSDTANNEQQPQGRKLKVNDNDTGASSRSKGEERQLWDFSKHGQEELQQELTRYLRRHRLAKKNAEKAAALAAENASAALAAEEKAAGLAAAGEGEEEEEEEDEDASAGSNSGTARRKKVTTPRRRVSSSTRLGRYSRSAVDLARQQREERQQGEERRLELEERAREEEEKWRRKQEGRPIPVGNGAGSAVVGDLEPVPNSREADQLEHLSRLLWDGEEEPEDFALSYGKQPEGRSLQ